MPEKPFVINDRRKFTAEGDVRHDSPATAASTTAVADAPEPDTEPGRSGNEPGRTTKEPIAFPSSSPKSPSLEPDRSEDEPDDDDDPTTAARGTHETIAFPGSSSLQNEPDVDDDQEGAYDDSQLPPPPTPEQLEQAAKAYAATVERLDTAMRAQNLGGERMPEMSFERFVQSLYMQALLQLGAAAEPNQPPRVDILGARQTIDMLAIIVSKSASNLSGSESRLVTSALFELHMGFLEVTQALARQAASRQPGAPAGPSQIR